MLDMYCNRWFVWRMYCAGVFVWEIFVNFLVSVASTELRVLSLKSVSVLVIQYCYLFNLSSLPWFNEVNVLWVVTIMRRVMFSDIPHRHLISCLLRPDIFAEVPSNCVFSLRVTDLVSQRHVFGWMHLISSEGYLFPFVTKRIAM